MRSWLFTTKTTTACWTRCTYRAPSEGYGFSNNAYGFLAPPSFEAAAVTIARANSHVVSSITLSYPHWSRKKRAKITKG